MAVVKVWYLGESRRALNVSRNEMNVSVDGTLNITRTHTNNNNNTRQIQEFNIRLKFTIDPSPKC